MSATLRTSLIATFAALILGAATLPALAQDAGDPPSDVARIAVISGAASTHQPGSQDWQAAAQNYPLAPGSGVWTQPRSHAAVDVAGARVHLDASSQLEVTAINQGQVQLAVAQGAALVRVYPGVSGVNFQINTAHGAAYINQPGQYEIVAGDDQNPSSLSVIEGQAQFVGQNGNFALQAGQRGNIAPDNQSSVDAVQPDDFVRQVQAEEQPYQQQVAQTAQYVSPQQTGYQDLARYGQWNQDPQYGAVWYPQQVQAGWAPYRYGHWAYVAPWGWTWVDDAAWGFTPFHYGRWVEVRNRWGWVPGERVVHPVYAPALVSFFGDIGGVGIDVSVGWVPLGPQEVYVPYYRHSPRYVREVNITNVRNETTIINVVNKKTVINYNTYVNHRGATSVSRDVMAGGHPVAQDWSKHGNRQDQQQWAKAKPEQELPFQPQVNAKAERAEGPKFKQQPQWSQQQNNGKATAQPSNQAKASAQPGKDNGKPWNNNGQGQPNVAAQSGKTWNNNNQGKPGQQNFEPNNKSNGNKTNNAKPKNNGPIPYIPPVNGNGQQSSGQQQSPAPTAATNVPVAPKPNKTANAPQWSANSNTQDKKHKQQPGTLYPTNAQPVQQTQQQGPAPQWNANNKTQTKKHQEPQTIYPANAQPPKPTQQYQQEQVSKKQLKAQQQQQQMQQMQQQQKAAQQPKVQQQQQHNAKPKTNQQPVPQQNCGQQPGACQQ